MSLFGACAQHGVAHVARAAHVFARDAGRRRQMHRTGDQLHVRAHLGGGLCDRETHAAGTAVTDETHGIDVFERRSRADQNFRSAQHARAVQCATSASTS